MFKLKKLKQCCPPDSKFHLDRLVMKQRFSYEEEKTHIWYNENLEPVCSLLFKDRTFMLGVWFPALICTGDQLAKVGRAFFIKVEYPEM